MEDKRLRGLLTGDADNGENGEVSHSACKANPCFCKENHLKMPPAAVFHLAETPIFPNNGDVKHV